MKKIFLSILLSASLVYGEDMNISKIVIPAAGLGTRFLPFTKAVPKELLPLVNKPALQEVVEEGLASGVSNFYLVISEDKPQIEEYFTRNDQLDQLLHKNNKLKLLEQTNALIEKSVFHYINQPEMLGLGHAVLMAEQQVQNQPFGVILPDDIIVGDQPGMKQLIDVANKHNAIVVAVMEVPGDGISAYGSIKPGKELEEGVVEILDIIEKPKPQEAFSNLGIIGRYVFTPAIFDAIRDLVPHSKGEIQLTDAIANLAKQGHKVVAVKIKGRRFDLGRPPGWFQANMYLGMHSPEYGEQIREIIRDLVKEMPNN